MSVAVFIACQRAGYRIPYAVACRALGVSQSWFYKWRAGDVSLRRARRRVLSAAVGYLFRRHRGAYGSPRITADLKDLGWRVSVNTVAAVMAEQDLVARRRRRRRGLTKASAAARRAPDLLGRDFTAPARPNVAWVGDLTEIPNDEGVFYLATVQDLHSRRLIGFAMSARHDPAVAKAALQMAIAVRGGDVDGVIFHSDQGGEYTGEVFAKACRGARIRQSMGRTGSALDNAVAESFNSTLEFEVLSASHFATRAQARRAVAGWIEEYNQTRRHSTDAMLSPVAFERAQAHALRAGGVKPEQPAARARNSGDGFAVAVHANRRARYGAATHASRVLRSLRDGLRPPLTREPRRPRRTGNASRPGPARSDARQRTYTKIQVSTVPGD